MKKREKDRISALIWLAVAIAICIGGVRLSLGGFSKPGPGLFPFLIGSVLGHLAMIIFFQSFPEGPGDEGKPMWPHPQRSLKVIYILIALILYAIGMDYLGFSVSTLLFLGFLLKAIEPQRWTAVLCGSIFGTIVFYGVFRYWLDVPFPEGILGF